MARYEHLTIFQKSYDFLLRIYKEVDKFPKGYKYSLGGRLQDVSLELLDSIVIVNSQKEKKAYLKKANLHITRLRIYVRLCHSLNIIGKRKYEVLSKYIDEIGRMAGGWVKSS